MWIEKLITIIDARSTEQLYTICFSKKQNERNWVCPICKGQSQTYAQSCEH